MISPDKNNINMAESAQYLAFFKLIKIKLLRKNLIIKKTKIKIMKMIKKMPIKIFLIFFSLNIFFFLIIIKSELN